LIEINLLPMEMQKKNKKQSWQSILPLGFALTLLSMVIGVSLAQWWQINQYQEQIKLADNNLPKASYLNQDLAQWQEEKKKVELGQKWKADLNKEKVEAAGFLKKLAEIVPENAWLTKVSLQGGNVTIEGKGISYNALVAFLNVLKTSGSFQGEPRLVSSQSNLLKEGSDINIVTFVIKGTLLGGAAK